MAIAFDAAAQSSVTSTTLTYSHTCSGASRMLFVGMRIAGSGSVTSVTYAGVTMTQAAVSAGAGGGTTTKAYLYGLIAPASGANNIVITVSTSMDIAAASASYTGVSQSSQPQATATNADPGPGNVTTLSQSVTTVGDNSWAVMIGVNDNGNPESPGTGSTERADTSVGSAIYDSNGPKTPAGSYSMAYSGVSGHFAMAMASFAPAAGVIKTIDGVNWGDIKTINGVS